MKSSVIFIAGIVALTNALTGEELRVNASVPARSLVPLLKPAVQAIHPEIELAIAVEDTPSVVDHVRTGKTQVGLLTRNLKKPEAEERPAFVAQPIGADALVLVVPTTNPVQGLTGDQVRAIWTGGIVNWREVGGPDLPIRVIGRTKKYDPIQLFADFMKLESQFGEGGAHHRVKGQQAWSSNTAVMLDSDDAALQSLLTQPGAVSYFPIARLLKERANGLAVKGLMLDGVEATPVTVADKGAYYLRRTLNAVTKGPPDAASKRFIDMLLSPDGQQLISQAGFMPLKPKSP